MRCSLAFIGGILAIQVNGQSGGAVEPPRCLASELHAAALVGDPAYAVRHAVAEWSIAHANELRVDRGGGPLVITVVVHIVHDGGPENLSDADVLHGIDQLNEAFANAGEFNDPDGVVTGIQFCLAQRDPDGLATTGIEHIQSTLTDLLVEPQDLLLKALSHWDPLSYLNIYVLRSITSTQVGEGVAGYAYLPAMHGQPADGVVVESIFLGGANDDAKVTFHEVGHYLGLFHTFDGGCTNSSCLTNGDRVCDTPPDESTASVACDEMPNSCTTDEDDPSTNNPFRAVALGGLGDQPDPIHNYMDYGYNACQTHFTNGQAELMVGVLTTTRASLLQSMGCVSPCDIPFNVAFSTTPAGIVAPGDDVVLTSTSVGATQYDWVVDGAPSGTAASISTQFAAEGAHTVQLQATNDAGNCLGFALDTILVDCPGSASFTVSNTQVLPFDTVFFTNTSTGVSGFTWHLDGQPIGSAIDTSLVFPVGGSFLVYLTSAGPDCPNTSTTVFIQVGSCTDYSSDMHWYFGDSAALDFNGSVPVALANSSMYAREGTSAWSDANGDLLFYTNGLQVFNRLHQQMPNGGGLMGGPTTSSINQALIVPMPGDQQKFYVIAMDELENQFANGVTWSIVDMALDNGLGDVALANQPLLFTGCETMGACYHANGSDVWLVFPVVDPAVGIHVFHVTPTGIVPAAVVPLPGYTYVNRTYFAHGGKRMVCSLRQGPATYFIRIYDFDPATGALTNPLDVATVQNSLPFTMEFAPSDRFLYAARIIGVDQYDLAQTTALGIQNSAVTVYSNTFPSALRSAPDGLVYGEWSAFNHIPRIQFPEVQGLGCGYQMQGQSIAPGRGIVGLPTFIKGKRFHTFVTLDAPDTVCIGSAAVVEAMGYDPECDYDWYVNDELVQTADPGTLVLPYAGLDSMHLRVNKGCACGGISGETTIHFAPGPSFTLGPDTTACAGQTVVIDAGSGYTSYTWSNGSTLQSTSVSSSGDVWVEVESPGGCALRDTIHVDLVSLAPPVDLGPDTIVCTGAVVVLDAGAGYSSYSWQDAWTEQIYTAWLPGTYTVTATSPCGSSTDTIVVQMLDPLALDLGPDTTICPGNTIVLGPVSANNVLWSNGSMASVLAVSAPGTYWAEIALPDGCTARDTVLVGPDDSCGPPCPEGPLNWYHERQQPGSWLSVPCFTGEGTGRVYDARGRLVIDTFTIVPGTQWVQHGAMATAAYVLVAVYDGSDHELKFVINDQ